MDNSLTYQIFVAFNYLMMGNGVVGFLAMVGSLYDDYKERKRVERIRKKYQ